MTKHLSESLWQSLCTTLEKKRKESKLSHQQIADLTGITRSNISRIFEGKAIPSVSSFISICAVIDKKFARKIEKLVDGL